MPQRNPNATDTFRLDDAERTPTPEASVASTISTAPKRTGIFIPLTEDGKLDSSRVRDTAKVERVRQALQITTSAAVAPESLKVNPAYISHACSLLEVGIQFAGKHLLKWPKELAAEMYFSPDKKKDIVEPATKVIEKYSPKWLVANQDIAALGIALTAAINDMVIQGTERWAMKVKSGQAPMPSSSAQVTPPQELAPETSRTPLQ